MKQKDPIKLMVTIVHRGKGDTVAKQFGKDHVGTHYVCHGFGTASSEMMDYLGIGEPEKTSCSVWCPFPRQSGSWKTCGRA